MIVLTRSQRQDELVKMCPDGIAKVVRRPKTNPDGSEIVCITEYEFPEWQCDSLMNRFWEVYIQSLLVKLNCVWMYCKVSHILDATSSMYDLFLFLGRQLERVRHGTQSSTAVCFRNIVVLKWTSTRR